MKFQEMEYVIAVARTNSFSKAAKELYVSQPNVSSTINSLEGRLGYKLFERTNQGINLTPEGNMFLKHANKILKEYQMIETITEEEPYHSLSIESMFNHTLVSRAFVKLCLHYQDESNLDLSIHSSSARDIIDNIYMGRSDLGIMLMNQTTIDNNLHLLPKKDMELKVLKRMTINVNIRLDHPLANKKEFNFYDLYNYPFVTYYDLDYPDTMSMDLINTSSNSVNSVTMINPSKIISVDGRDTRGQVVVSTDAFSVGCSFHPETTRLDQLISIPIPGIESLLVLIYKTERSTSEEFILFNKFLKEELDKI